jgi:predicted RNA-binding protein YlxR (DUF448 family)
MTARIQNHALDAGPRKGVSVRQRFCAATGEVKPVDEMIRFVIDPGGAAVPDLRRRLPGRGIWITATRQALQTAVIRKAFAHGFRRDVRAGTDLIDLTEQLLEQSALDALAVCHKAGKLAVGFAKADAALARDRVVGFLHAAEAGSDGTSKLAAALHRRQDAEQVTVVKVFTSAQLDLALGRSNVVHAALLAGPESGTFLARTARLDCFRAGPKSGSPNNGKRGKRGRRTSDLHGGGMKRRGETPGN